MAAAEAFREEFQARFRAFRSCAAAELVEFAVVVPFLAVLVVAISDFGAAWTVRDKLANAARDGARAAVSAPNDLASPLCQSGQTPCSVQVAAGTIVQYLGNTNLNTCGMTPASVVPAQGSGASSYSWTYSASGGGCPKAWTIFIERAVQVSSTDPVTHATAQVLCTRVTISYPFSWNFAHVVKLIAPSSSYASTITLQTAAVMPNLN